MRYRICRTYLVLVIIGAVLALTACTPTDSELIRKAETRGTVTDRHKAKTPWLVVNQDGPKGKIKVFVTYTTYKRCTRREHYPECAK